MKPRAPKPRQRRTPEATRELILDATDRLFAHSSPDAVGLKEVAREAGVSHALVTHYFGTYRHLVDAAIDRLLSQARTKGVERFVSSGFGGSDAPLLDALLEVVRAPATIRLLAWRILAQREGEAVAVENPGRGLRMVTELIGQRLRALGLPVEPGRIEATIVMSIGAVLGLALFGPTLSSFLGKSEFYGFDPEQLRPELAKMVRAYLLAPEELRKMKR